MKTAVRVATPLSLTTAAMPSAQAAMLNFEWHGISDNTANVVDSGLTYTPASTVTQYYSLDTVTHTGTAHEVIQMGGNTFASPTFPAGFGFNSNAGIPRTVVMGAANDAGVTPYFFGFDQSFLRLTSRTIADVALRFRALSIAGEHDR